MRATCTAGVITQTSLAVLIILLAQSLSIPAISLIRGGQSCLHGRIGAVPIQLYLVDMEGVPECLWRRYGGQDLAL